MKKTKEKKKVRVDYCVAVLNSKLKVGEKMHTRYSLGKMLFPELKSKSTIEATMSYLASGKRDLKGSVLLKLSKLTGLETKDIYE